MSAAASAPRYIFLITCDLRACGGVQSSDAQGGILCPGGDIVTKVRPRGGYDSGDELTSARGVDQGHVTSD